MHLSLFGDSHSPRKVEDPSHVGRVSASPEKCDESTRRERRKYENGAGERGSQHGGTGFCLQLTFPPARWPEQVEFGRAQRRNASETYRIHGRGGSGRKMASPRGRQGLWRGARLGVTRGATWRLERPTSVDFTTRLRAISLPRLLGAPRLADSRELVLTFRIPTRLARAATHATVV